MDFRRRGSLQKITTNREQEALFDACDSGLPIVMERNGHEYLVVRYDRLDTLATLLRPKLDAPRIVTPPLLGAG